MKTWQIIIIFTLIGIAIRLWIKIIIDYLQEFCLKSTYSKLSDNICRDKNDNDIIALALSNKVDYLITGDNDLLVLKKYKNIKIINPREFWVIVKKNK